MTVLRSATPADVRDIFLAVLAVAASIVLGAVKRGGS
jgi:hypothetical protein